MRLAFIINRTRFCPRRRAWLRRRFANADATFHITGAAGEGTYLARRAAERGRSVIVAVGGDGTVNEVVNGLYGSPATLGIIPCGTANDFASALGVPRRPAAAADILSSGRVLRVSLGRANGRCFVSGGGIGLAATALACADRFRSRCAAGNLGTVAYVLGLLQALLTSGDCETRLHLEHAGGRFATRANLFLVGRVPTLGGRFRAFPGADPRDRRLSLCRFSFGGRRWSLACALGAALWGQHVHHDGVTRTWVSECTLVADRPMLFFADGEFWAPVHRLHLTVWPGALGVYVPRSRLAEVCCNQQTQIEGAAPAHRGTAPGVLCEDVTVL